MFRHLFKLIWNKKKQNFLLLSEMLLSFMVMFAIFTFIAFSWRNYLQPMNFEYENVWNIHFTEPIKFDYAMYHRPENEGSPQALQQQKNVDSILQFYERMRKDVAAVPGIKAVSYASGNIPFSGSNLITGLSYKGKWINEISMFDVNSSYIDILNIKLTEGRWFNKDERAWNSNVVVINEALKEKMIHKTHAVGEIIDDYDKKQWKIIGVTRDLKVHGDYQPASPAIYELADSIDYARLNDMLIKVDKGVDAGFESRLYKKLASYLKNSTIEIEHLSAKRESANKLTLVPLVILCIVAAFLVINVALGLFGVLWYNINKRRGEIGLRRAVGATGTSVTTQLVLESLIMATLSLIIGSFFAVQFPLLNVFDLPSIVYIVALISAVLFIYLLVFLCSVYPGRQAAAIYPAVALHED